MRATLYVRNLDDQLAPARLQANLYVLCSGFGRVSAVRVGPRTRGQAFVTFAEARAADRALAELGGRAFFGRPLRVERAREPTRLV